VVDPIKPKPFPAAPILMVTGLGFSYPGSSEKVLDDIHFSLQEGEGVAIVGPSGAGKSTLSYLLVRFWGGYHGKITLGKQAVPLNQLNQEAVRQHISVISQTGYLFNDTIRTNIALGNPNSSDQQIIQAAKKARIHQLIEGLPEGYNTFIGERGQQLSAGERQRILIARAVLKDAPFFLLDEPTANLDPLTEREILSTFNEILQEKTSLLITHRLVGLGRMNQILVLDRGHIVEQGSEVELLSHQGLYHHMWTLQNRILNYA